MFAVPLSSSPVRPSLARLLTWSLVSLFVLFSKIIRPHHIQKEMRKGSRAAQWGAGRGGKGKSTSTMARTSHFLLRALQMRESARGGGWGGGAFALKL